LFTDLDLKNDKIVWDFDNDGKVDIEDNTAFEYAYTDSKLHTVSYKLPEL
jgi:PKD repeat protein